MPLNQFEDPSSSETLILVGSYNNWYQSFVVGLEFSCMLLRNGLITSAMEARTDSLNQRVESLKNRMDDI